MKAADFSPAGIRYRGLLIALLVLGLWAASLVLALRWPGFDVLRWQAWAVALPWMLLQMHLFTGVFITAHDAMHGVVVPAHPRLNHLMGWVCATAFVFNRYDVLLPKHHLHHRHAGTPGDPDFHKGNPGFWRWYLDFALEYIRWPQILLAAILFNLLHHFAGLPVQNLLIFWALPSILSTLQLFFFGTYRPHMGEHAPGNRHRSRSQAKNHVVAFLTCYFFGYHYEHHDNPATPWWRLWRLR